MQKKCTAKVMYNSLRLEPITGTIGNTRTEKMFSTPLAME